MKLKHKNIVHVDEDGLKIHTANSYVLQILNKEASRVTPQFREVTFDCKEAFETTQEPTNAMTEPMVRDSMANTMDSTLKPRLTGRRSQRRESNDFVNIWKSLAGK